MTPRPLSRFWLCFGISLLLCRIVPAAEAEELQADRTEFAVGESVTLKIPGALGLIKPKWSASPEGVVSFKDKDRTEAVVKGVTPGRVTVSARVKGLLGDSTTHTATLTVKPAGTGRTKPVVTGSGAGAGQRPALDDARMLQIGDLLKRYEAELGSIRTLFDKSADKDRTPGMGELTERKLGQVTEEFFQELGGMGLSVWHLQQFKEQYKAASAGGSALFPGQGAWDDAFLGTERALMMGRAQLVQRLWRETLQDTFSNNPDAAVFGEIDIGSWVKMRLGDLGFQADIDFSSVSIDPDLNRWIVDQFEGKLRQHTSLDMVKADALLTPHGQATADVFIGDWGKTFAELDMLKRSKWKVIKVQKAEDGKTLVLDENGKPKIRMVEKPGAQLFWEVAFRKLQAGQSAEVEFPKMDLAKEPMLSLEMLRHGIHDIEHGPYSRGQKLIKMLKYAERSYFMNKKAVAEFGFNPYADNDPVLAQAAEKIIANKSNPEKVADLLRTLSGEDITTDNVDGVTDKLVDRAKTAMHDNAARALAFRLNAIARIDADDARQKAAEKLWADLGTELDTYRNTAGEPPKIMVEAQAMAKAVMEGKLPPAELEAKANELHKLLNDAYKLPDSVIDRILMSDSVLKLKAYLRKLGWVEKAIDDFADKAKRKFPNVANFHGKVVELNEQLEKTTSGSGLLKAADWADNAFTVYEAYLNSDASDALWNASLAMGRVGAQSYVPSLQIPLAVYDSFKSGSPKPLGMAVAFMYFPFAGQTYMVSGLMQRADVGMRDTEFYDALNKVLEITEFDTRGKITGFSLRNILGREIDSESISPPGDRKAIVALFTRPDSTFYTSPNFRYWSSLVPRQDDRFGRYENKLQNLRRFFGLSEDVRYMTVMLENFKAKTDALPQDRFTAQRRAALEKMEEQLTEAIWVAMADMLESAARSVNVAELETKVKKYEEDLNLGDDDLGKNKGLLARIRQEIRQNSSLLRGENPYAVALIYDRTLKAYERVDALRKQIVLEIWSGGFDIDYVATQGKPMKLLLLGGKSGAPALTGDPAKDVELAEDALAAHRARAESLRADLATALDRPLDPARDKDHLKALGQIGLEWEHLLDDCAGRAAPNCEAGVRAALQQRVKLYKDYLARLAAANQAIALEITGPAELKLGESSDYAAKFAKAEDAARPGLALNWWVNGQAAGTGATLNVKAERAGSLSLALGAASKASGSEKKLGEATRTVSVKAGPADKPAGADKNLAGEIAPALQARDWKRLADRLDAEKKSDLKMKDVVAWQANIDALNAALKTLRDERMDWALAWRDYVDALDHVDSLTWDKLTRQVEAKRGEAERRCWDNSSDSEAADKRIARCQTEGRKFEESCVGTWPAQHWEEMKRLRMAKQELPDAVQLLHSAGYGGYRNWFEAVEKLAEQYKLPFPYPKPVTPRLKYALSCANVDLPTGKQAHDGLSTLQVRVAVPGAIVPYGKPVALNASASGGKAPYAFAWSTGASGDRASVTPRWAGEWTVTVTATDAEGKTGEGQGTLMVSPAKVKLTGTQPQVFYGSRAVLSLPGQAPPPPVADPCAGRKATNPFDECLRIDVKDLKSVSTASPGYVPPAPGMVSDPDQVRALPEPAAPARPGAQRVVWQSEPALEFAPPTSEGGKDSGRTNVTYNRMGEVKLWCEILESIEGAFHTVGECDQETVNVIAPKFSITFSPPEGQGRIGQDIRLSIGSEPPVPDDLIDFRWFDPATANRLELTPNARDIGFKAKDEKPVVFKALARVPHYGDSIADIAATYTGLQFQVKAWAEEPGTRPMMWDPVKGGLKPVPKGQYATHERIPLRAELQGGEAPSGLRWNWNVNDGTTISNPISQTPTVSRSGAGTIEATVEARDAGGAVLGSGSVSLSVIEARDTPPAPVNPAVSLDADRTRVERGETVSFSANATGGKPPYRYAWQGASGQGAQATLATSRTGNQPVGVTVTDSQGKSATARVEISVAASARDIARDQAGKLAAQSAQQAKAGDLAGAAKTIEAARQHDADTARPVAAQIRDQAKLAAATAEKKRDFKESGRLFEAARRADPTDRDAQVGANNAAGYQQRQDAMVAKQQQLAGHIARGDWHLAETAQAELKIMDEGLPGGLTPETRDLIKRYQDGQAAYARQVDAKRKDIAADLQAKRYASARARLAALRQTRLIPADEEWARGMAQAIDQAEADSQGKKAAGAPSGLASIAGKWRSSEGELTLAQNGRAVSGSYGSDGGEIVGELNGNVLEGDWIENGSSERCTTAKNGRYHWGRIRWTFDGDRFAGNWSYCDKPVAGGGNWSGERTGTGAAVAASAGPGLIAAYALDGDARDASGNNRHGAVQGAKATADRFGRAGGAMLFDGKSFIELPLDINPGAYPRLTFTAWVRADDASPVRQVMSHDNGGYDRSLGIDSRGGGSGWSAFAGTGGVLGFKPVEKGRWTFVAAVWDETAHKVRLQVDDAAFEKSGDSGGSDRKLNLGRNPGYGEYFIGAMDDVRLYDRALDTRAIRAIRDGADLAGGTAATGASGLAGAWNINANGYTGKLELAESGGRLSGRVWFDAHQVWEDLREISFDGRILRFLRPGPNQRYTGSFSGNEVRGSFDGGGTWNWSMTRGGAAVATSSAPRIAEFTWNGMDEDRVGDWGNGKPNGTRDGHFRLTLEAPGRFALASLSVWSANEKGEKAGGQIWHTRNGGNWMLGVFRDGRQLNASHVASLGEFTGRVSLDLYANGSGWFNPGQWFLLEVEGADGKVARQALRLGDASEPGAAGRVNLARGKPASQSSTSEWSRANDAQGAVDGVINGGYAFHTGNQANPWWQVDLGGAYRLSEVRLYNRLDCCGERARTVQVMLSGDGRAWRTAYRHDGTLFGGRDGRPLIVPLGGETARYVRLQLNEPNWFHLDEVEVMGWGEASNPAIDGGRDYTYQDGGRDYTYRDRAGPSPASAPARASEPQSLEEAGRQLKDAVKDLKNLFKW